jgi:probable HAF family extracellular repeat protein
MRHPLLLLLAVTLLLTASLAASADYAYSLVDLGPSLLAGGSTFDAASVNNFGQVTGNFFNGSNISTFLYSGGTMTDLGGAAGYTSTNQGSSINDSGQITGTMNGNVLLYSGGVMHNLGNVGGQANTAYGSGINKLGQITGYYTNSSGTQTGILYSGGLSGTTTELGTLPGGFFSVGNALNNSGEVTGVAGYGSGEHAFTWTSGGGMVDLGTLAGGSGNSAGYAINSSGEVAGESDTTESIIDEMNGDAFFWSSGSGMVDLGVLGGENGSSAYGINDLAQVVGASSTAAESMDAFLWTKGTGMEDLNNLIAPGSGWTLEEANAISNTGYIVGFMTDAAGDQDGFLLDPNKSGPATPEPGTLSLVGFGLLGLAGYRRRRCAAK